jgi:hypothetical protein
MTNTQDLSLLTDEEHKKYKALPFAVEEVAIDDIREVFHALIAARAENKRKDDVMAKLIDAAEQGRSLLRQMAEVSSLAGRRGAHERADAIDAVLKEAAALLQSEKGGE